MSVAPIPLTDVTEPALPAWFAEVTTLTEQVGRAQVHLTAIAAQYRSAYTDLRLKEEKLRNAVGKHAATFNPREHRQAVTAGKALREVEEDANGDLGGLGPGVNDRGTGARRGTSTAKNIDIIDAWFRNTNPVWTTPKLVYKAVDITYGSAIYAMHIMVHRNMLQRIGTGKYRRPSDAGIPRRDSLTPPCKRKKPAPFKVSDKLVVTGAKPATFNGSFEIRPDRVPEPAATIFTPLPGLAVLPKDNPEPSELVLIALRDVLRNQMTVTSLGSATGLKSELLKTTLEQLRDSGMITLIRNAGYPYWTLTAKGLKEAP